MQNAKEIIDYFDKSKSDLVVKGAAILVIGESGIGKTWLLHKVVQAEKKDHCVINIAGSRVPGGSGLSCFYEGVYLALKDSNIEREQWYELVKRATMLLPGFGKHISSILGVLDFNSLGKISERTGFHNNGQAAPQAVRFVEAVARKRKIIVVVDDAQWIDVGTWEFLSFILRNNKELNWVILTLLNDSVTAHKDVNKIQESLENIFDVKDNYAGHFQRFVPQRWCVENIGRLIVEICSAKKCNLTHIEKKIIHEITNGIPKFTEEIVNALLDDGLICLIDGEVKSQGDWANIDFPETLEGILKSNYSQLFEKVKKSREALEIASVIGEVFTDEIIGSIANIDEINLLFKQIESQSKVIEDLFVAHKWRFRHTLNHRAIYGSIGTNVGELHQKVAVRLNEVSPNECEAIAYHYRQAGLIEEAIAFDIKSANNLIDCALFQSVVQRTILIERDAQELTFPSNYIQQALLLRGRAFFYLNRFNEAINVFSNPIFNQHTDNVEATRWLGRCYVSLCSQRDFIFAIKYFEKAISFFEAESNKKSLALTLSELSVAYEHCNRYKDTEISYKKAEMLLSELRDEIGINRLWRRSGMVLDGAIGSKVVKKAADRFKRWKMPHEQVMALNNAAVAYLYCGNNEEFGALLKQAINVSIEIYEFGLDHLLCNMSIYYLLKNDITLASESIMQARQIRERDATNLVVDIVGSAISSKMLPLEEALAETERVYFQCLAEGELSFILPALLNFSNALERNNEIDLAIIELEKIKPIKVDTIRYYAHCQQSKWLQRLVQLYRKKNEYEYANLLESEYYWCKAPTNNHFYTCNFGAVPTQFCSP